MIIINLPVADIERSQAFFTDLGYTYNEEFCGEDTLALVLGENQVAMLIQTEPFTALHQVQTANAFEVKECIICLSAGSRDAVDALVDRAIIAGGTVGDTEDLGFMYGRSYNDLDGHSWQIFWMNASGSADHPEERSRLL